MAHDLARSALWYARHGWRVFPCQEREKLPAIKAWQKLATTDEALVRNWWRWPKNIGLACGPASGVFVIDIDQHGIDGEASLQELIAKLGPLPTTLEQRTGSGGRQLLFRWPDGRKMRNRAGGKGGMPPAVDTRGDGGFVVIPPSIHPCGERYRWIIGPHQGDLAELPPTWVTKLEKPKDPPRILLPMRPLKCSSDWDRKQFETWRDQVGNSKEGHRSDVLYGRVKDTIRRLPSVSQSDIEFEMQTAGEASGLSPIEVRKTIQSAISSASGAL